MLHIAAWTAPANFNIFPVPVVMGAPAADDQVSVSASSAQSDVLSATGWTQALICRLYADEACIIAVGTNPTAVTTGGYKIAAGATEWIALPFGQRFAVIGV